VRVRVKNLSSDEGVADVSFEIHAGEIVGMAGLVGAGRTEVAEALFGVSPCQSSVRLDQKTLRVRTARDAITNGVYLIPEDRRQAGLITEDVIRQNITLPALKRYATAGMIAKLRPLLTSRSGATALEYGLIAALIAVAAVTVMGTVGTNLSSTFNTIAGKL